MGNLYNMVFGHNPATLLLAPMLTDDTPLAFFPRFRDCFEDDGNIVIYTRVGGGNRSYDPNPPHAALDNDEYCGKCDYGEDKLYDMPTFIKTYDDDFDSTYGCYVFGVPDEWKSDFDAIMSGRFDDVSDAYVARMERCFSGIIFGRELLDTMKISPGALENMSKAPDWKGYFDSIGVGDGEA